MIQNFNTIAEQIKNCNLCESHFGFKPHPFTLNIKWFKDHPAFLSNRIEEVRDIIKSVLE